jgi:hypothetical protein
VYAPGKSIINEHRSSDSESNHLIPAMTRTFVETRERENAPFVPYSDECAGAVRKGIG